MTSWLKATLVGFAVAAVFVAGYRYAAYKYQAQIAEIKAEQALAMKEKTDEYRAKEQSQAKQLADAWDKYEKARAESVDLRSDVERVRELANGYLAKLSGAGSDSCDAIRERLAGCTKLLEEGATLSSEGARLSEGIAVKKDAVVKISTGR